ncbi:MAG: hypothetical protein ACYDHP_10610 [Ferrimicrobium sp.]
MTLDNQWLLEQDDATFSKVITTKSFEELRDTAQDSIELLGDQQVAFDQMGLIVRRTRALLTECQRRIESTTKDLESQSSQGEI